MSLESHTDVLIIGAGPTGVMCANALAMAGVNTRIIDKRPDGVAAGHADAFAPRTLEVLQSYSIAEALLREGNQVHMFTIYTPDSDGTMKCTGRVPYVTDPNVSSPFLLTLQQASIEAIFLESLKTHGVNVERPKQPLSIEISEDIGELSNPLSYPVKVAVECLDDRSKKEIIHAKYVVGADGAHSWVRRTLGICMEGEQTDHVWGVIDTIADSDFPDIHNLSTVHSLNGTCLLIPREHGKTRLYIQLSEMDPSFASTGNLDKSSITPEELLSVSRKILHPYKLADPKKVEWYSLYNVGQRIASSYSAKGRVFIAGDACHTHSPKGGQGMNAGINDAHNLAWKLVHVIRGWSSSSLLGSYENERRKFAQDLLNLDKEYTKLYTKKPMTVENEDGASTEQYLRMAKIRQGFLTGLGIHYPPSLIVDEKHHECAKNLIIGQRMPPYKFVRAANMRPVNIHELLPADSRFKMVFFVGRLTSSRIAELELLADQLTKSSGILRKYGVDGNTSTIFDIITIMAIKKHDMKYLLLPELFRPHWTKVLLDDTDLRNISGGQAYEKFGIDPEMITVVVVRPDGYVGTIVPSTALGDLEEYFDSFMIPRVDSGSYI